MLAKQQVECIFGNDHQSQVLGYGSSSNRFLDLGLVEVEFRGDPFFKPWLQ